MTVRETGRQADNEIAKQTTRLTDKTGRQDSPITHFFLLFSLVVVKSEEELWNTEVTAWELNDAPIKDSSSHVSFSDSLSDDDELSCSFRPWITGSASFDLW